MRAPWVRGSERDFTWGRQGTWPPLLAHSAVFKQKGVACFFPAWAPGRRPNLAVWPSRAATTPHATPPVVIRFFGNGFRSALFTCRKVGVCF